MNGNNNKKSGWDLKLLLQNFNAEFAYKTQNQNGFHHMDSRMNCRVVKSKKKITREMCPQKLYEIEISRA